MMEPYLCMLVEYLAVHQHFQPAATGTVVNEMDRGGWVDNFMQESEVVEEQDAHNQASQSDELASQDDVDANADTEGPSNEEEPEDLLTSLPQNPDARS